MNQIKKPSIDWNRFKLFTAHGSEPHKALWRPTGVFPAETCARHVYIGLDTCFNAMPNGLRQAYGSALYGGTVAYQFAVSLYAGLKGPNFFEQHDSRQIRNAWNSFQTNCAPGYKALKPFIDIVFQDGKQVVEKVLFPYRQQPTIVNTAVAMAGLSPDAAVLVIGGSQEFSLQALSALGHKKKTNPGKILFTHTDGKTLENVLDEVRKLPTHRALDVAITPVPLEQAFASELFTVSAVFICQSSTDGHQDLRQDWDQTNRELQGCWQKRLEQTRGDSAKIFYLQAGGKKHNQRQHNAPPGIVPHADIKANQERRIAIVQKILEKAAEAIVQMSQLRLKGQSPQILFDPDRMSVQCAALPSRGGSAQPRQGNHLST